MMRPLDIIEMPLDDKPFTRYYCATILLDWKG
jgi:hypothetical protein